MFQDCWLKEGDQLLSGTNDKVFLIKYFQLKHNKKSLPWLSSIAANITNSMLWLVPKTVDDDSLNLSLIGFGVVWFVV